MTTAPVVELGFNPTDLRPGDLPHIGTFLGSPSDALEAALAVTRAAMVKEMKDQVRGLSEPTHSQLLRIADLAWQAAFWRYRKISAPVMADAYIHAYRAADAGDVPMSVIHDLADKHAEKIGDYFHASSRDALADGFNSLVNRRIPAKAAADRVLDAYGLTPRQMRSYVGASQFHTPVSDVMPRSIKARARAYIDKAFTTRTRKLSRQEEHNIDQQAQQFAWMWLQDKGRLSKKAQKVWITAKDEKVCPVCGPLHGKRVGINDQFVTKEGAFWTPGLHPNCRCVVRLLENRFSKRDDDWDPKLHPRAYHGRFGTKARTQTIDVDEEFDQILAQPVRTPVRHITYAQPATAEPDTETDQQFASLIAAQPQGARRSLGSALDSPLQANEFNRQALAGIQRTEPMIDFAADLAVELRSQTRLALETKPRQRQQLKPATVPLGQPAYAVITHDQLAEGDISRIQLNHGIEFKTDEIAAAQEAGETIQRTVERRIEDMVDRGNRIEAHDDRTGLRYHADLKPRDIQRVAEWYANTATAHWHEDYDPNFIGDDTVEVDWELDEDVDLRQDKGTALPPKVRYSYIGEQFDLRSQDFEVYVVRADEVPDDEGSVEDISGSATSKHRSFSIDGDYEIVPGSVSKVVHNDSYAVTTYRIEPTESVMLPEPDLNDPDRSE